MFSIGHSNQLIVRFLDLLRAHQIELLVDVRSQPFCTYATHFDMDQIQPHLAGAGIRYIFAGNELGGRPRGSEFYDADGRVLYDKLAESPIFRDALTRVLDQSTQSRLAIMCAEEAPADCHRHLLIGRVLDAMGISLQHIRGDGAVQSYADLQKAASPEPEQLSLFSQESKPWKSTRSVSPKDPPPSSSTR